MEIFDIGKRWGIVKRSSQMSVFEDTVEYWKLRAINNMAKIDFLSIPRKYTKNLPHNYTQNLLFNYIQNLTFNYTKPHFDYN